MEPDMGGCRINRGGKRRCPGTNRVPIQSRFPFKCHRATNRKKERERKRERERDKQKSTNIVNINKI